MTIAISAVLVFYADFKYIKFFQFINTHPKPNIWESLPDFWKKSSVFPPGEKVFFLNQKKSFFPQEWLYKPMVQYNLKEAHSNVNLTLFFKWPCILYYTYYRKNFYYRRRDYYYIIIIIEGSSFKLKFKALF